MTWISTDNCIFKKSSKHKDQACDSPDINSFYVRNRRQGNGCRLSLCDHNKNCGTTKSYTSWNSIDWKPERDPRDENNHGAGNKHLEEKKLNTALEMNICNNTRKWIFWKRKKKIWLKNLKENNWFAFLSVQNIDFYCKFVIIIIQRIRLLQS